MARKALRLFRCKCNHQLRYGASTCPYCFEGTPLRNRVWVPVLAVVFVGLLTVFLNVSA
ncbi:MAG: hypothetical protein VX874_18160 [Pseudomonadota bacterium]|nr:hypothetical protein [Pseudomonadota bacterium]